MKTTVGFFDILCVAFIVLKLTDVIAWSWWWVLAPVWLPISIVIILMVLYFIFNR